MNRRFQELSAIVDVAFPARPDVESRRQMPRAHSVTPRERQVLTVIRTAGEISRSDLIKTTGLSGVAVFRITEDLAARGLIEIGGAVAKGRGQPSAMVRLRRSAVASVGLSVMTDFAEAVMMDFTGDVIAAEELTIAGMPRAALIAALSDFIDRATQARGIARTSVLGVGVAIAGFFVGDETRINPAAELDDWALIDLQPLIETQLGLPTMIENTANAAAVGERLLGVGRRLDSFCYLNFAGGLGAGLVIKGELARGAYGNAGELGGLMNDLGLPHPKLDSLRDTLHVHGVATSSITDMVLRYHDDWPGIDQWIATYTPSLKAMVSAIRYVTDVEAIVVGGRAPRPLAERIIAATAFADDTMISRRHAPLPMPQIILAEASTQSTAIAAAALPLRAALFQ